MTNNDITAVLEELRGILARTKKKCPFRVCTGDCWGCKKALATIDKLLGAAQKTPESMHTTKPSVEDIARAIAKSVSHTVLEHEDGSITMRGSLDTKQAYKAAEAVSKLLEGKAK